MKKISVSSKNSKQSAKAIITQSFATILLVGATPLVANAGGSDTRPPKQPKSWEKCYGMARAGMNDCTSLDGLHGCHGGARTDSDPNEWMWVPKNYCQKIVGGRLVTAASVRARKTKCQPNRNK